MLRAARDQRRRRGREQPVDLDGRHARVHLGVRARRQAQQRRTRRGEIAHRGEAFAHHTGEGRADYRARERELGGGLGRTRRVALALQHAELGLADAQAVGADEPPSGKRARLVELCACQPDAAVDQRHLGARAVELDAEGGVVQAHHFNSFETQCQFGGGRLLRHQCPACDVIFGPAKMLELNAAELSAEYDWHYRIFTEGDSTDQEIRAFYALDPQPGGHYLNYGAGAWSRSVELLRAQGWHITAYEPTQSAQQQPGLVTRPEELATLRFDGIYSNNVLEHLRHPVDELRHLASLLKPGARMSHATPCYEYLYEYTRFHLFFYLGRSRRYLAEQAGLDICHSTEDGHYMNTVYQPRAT